MTSDKNNKILNVPTLRFPEFSGEWEEHTLRDIADFSKGSGISKEQLSADGNPCILYGELYTKYSSEIISYIYSKTNIDDSKLVKSKTNDVLIPSSGETAVDIATARCVQNEGVLLGGDLNIIRLKHGNGAFLSYQLNGARKYDIAKVAQGVSVVHLYGESLKSVKVAMPTQKEQDKIAALLALVDERIATQNKIIDNLKSLIKGLAERLTQICEPNVCLSHCLECHTSSLQESDVSESGMYPVYGATGISGYRDDYSESCEAILIVKDGSGVGTVSYTNRKFSVIGTLNYLTAKNDYCLLYLYYALMAFNFTPYRTGMAIPHIYFKDYGKSRIFCPSTEQQHKVASLLYGIEKKIEVEQQLLNHLNGQKLFLLRSMFI